MAITTHRSHRCCVSDHVNVGVHGYTINNSTHPPMNIIRINLGTAEVQIGCPLLGGLYRVPSSERWSFIRGSTIPEVLQSQNML